MYINSELITPHAYRGFTSFQAPPMHACAFYRKLQYRRGIYFFFQWEIYEADLV